MEAEKGRLSLGRNAALNTAGFLIYCFCQWTLTLAVVRLRPGGDVGLFQLAMTVTNIFTALANYNMRTFQVSDVRGEYSAGVYTASRVLTCGAALFACLVYSLAWGYGGESLVCILWYMAYRLSESYADVLHGVDQQHGRMDHVLVSCGLRGLLMLGILAAVLAGGGSLSAAFAAMTCAVWAVVLGYDLRSAGRYARIRPEFNRGKLKKLMGDCLPGVLAGICLTAVVSVPRQTLASLMGEELLGYYATVATPLVVIQVLATSVINPAVSELAAAWEARDRKRILGLTGRLTAGILIFGAVALAGTAWIGEPVMTLVYGETIRPYVSLMLPVVGCTALYSVCWVGFSLLVVIREMKRLMCFSALALGAAALSAPAWIGRFGANGVSLCVMFAYLLLAGACFVCFGRRLGRKAGKEK